MHNQYGSRSSMDRLSDNEFLIAFAIVHALGEADGNEWDGIWLCRHGVIRTGKAPTGIAEVSVSGTTVSFHRMYNNTDIIAERNVCDPEATHELVELLRGFMRTSVCRRCCDSPCSLDHSRVCWRCSAQYDRSVVACMVFGIFLVISGMACLILQSVLRMS